MSYEIFPQSVATQAPRKLIDPPGFDHTAHHTTVVELCCQFVHVDRQLSCTA